MGSEWRKHIGKTMALINGKSYFMDRENWNYCPECGAERPKEPVKLWEKMVNLNTAWGHQFSTEVLAKIAIDEFIKLIHSFNCGDYYGHDHDAVKRYKKELKAKLEELR